MKPVKRMLVIGTESHYGSGVVEGVYNYCRTHGHWEYHLEPDGSEESTRRSDFAIRQWKADGIVACIQSNRMRDLIYDSRLPAVNVTGSYETTLPSVWADFYEIGRLIAEHFVGNGFRNFGFCVKTSELQALKKCEGFVDTLVKAGFTCDVLAEELRPPELDWVQSNRMKAKWLRTLKKPVAVMCTYDYLARDVASACDTLKLSVPDDVAIVGVQNQESVCMMCKPPLSSVEMQTRRIGFEAARLVDRLIRGAKPPTQPVLVPPAKLVVRQSSDILALNDADVAAAVRFIRKHAFEPIAIKDVLREVPISRRVLEQRFMKLMGRTPKSEITRLRMERAALLLRETELPIPGVAERSGFIGPETFAITFHRCMGVSPTLYRSTSRGGRTSGRGGP